MFNDCNCRCPAFGQVYHKLCISIGAHVSDIYANAVDSLRIGIEHFLKESGYSSRKHAILTLFHAIELFLKEQLHRTNPILIYRNIDAKITDDSMTVGIKKTPPPL